MNIFPESFNRFFSKRLKELTGLVLIACGALLLLALITYDAHDPSFSTATHMDNPNNILGVVGSYTSDIFLQWIGFGTFFIIILLWGWGALIFKKQKVNRIILRIVGLIFTTIILSAFLSSLTIPEFWQLKSGLGGMIGDVVNTKSNNLFSFLPNVIPIILLQALIFIVAVFVYGLILGIMPRHWGMAISYTSATLWAFALYVGSGLKNLFRRNKQNAIKKPPKAKKKAVKEQIIKHKAPAKKALRKAKVANGFELPSSDILDPVLKTATEHDKNQLQSTADQLESVLDDFGVKGEITEIRPGPVVTLYELIPAPGTKSSRVIGLSDDIARTLSAISVRIAVVPGQNVIGIEFPNPERDTVYLREMIESQKYQKSPHKLPLILGKNIGGEPIIVDLARMPHLLMAGTTGSGKSVAINTMILSLLYRYSPEECRMIMVDPKMLELSVYEGIPHLLSPVVTDPKKAVMALRWAVKEMENRYRAMSKIGVRNIEGYNARINESIKSGAGVKRKVQTGYDEQTGTPVYEEQDLDFKPFPYLVVIIDELADLMIVAGKDIESAIQRLAQMARAAGIHLIVATQRPSVDVITGTIKANFPTRISFRVTSKIDSRTILGEGGAENLLGLGDMLYSAGGKQPTRVHGPFVSDENVEEIVNHIKAQGEPCYVDAVTEEDENDPSGNPANVIDKDADLYTRAVQIVINNKKASTSFVQRQLRIGYNRAADLIDKMEAEGVISEPNHAGKRTVLLKTHE
jgi:DNA segregation ATPase FtsK/SpoIIIE, S-DNA-T family